MGLEVLPVKLSKDVVAGDGLDFLIFQSLQQSGYGLIDGDIVVIGHKVVSKSEGRVVSLSDVRPSEKASKIAREHGKDPRVVELILNESKEIVTITRGIIISETKHGWICANAGIDLSNTERGTAVLLPHDADKSAEKLRQKLAKKSGAKIAVIISDTFGRPFRNGQTNVAIGVSGIEPIKSYIGTKDLFGNELRVTEIAISDELAAAAELVMGKAESVPVALVRGYRFDSDAKTGAKGLIRAKEFDIFRNPSSL